MSKNKENICSMSMKSVRIVECGSTINALPLPSSPFALVAFIANLKVSSGKEVNKFHSYKDSGENGLVWVANIPTSAFLLKFIDLGVETLESFRVFLLHKKDRTFCILKLYMSLSQSSSHYNPH